MNKDYIKLERYLKKLLPDSYDLIDLESEFDSELTYEENLNHIKKLIIPLKPIESDSNPLDEYISNKARTQKKVAIKPRKEQFRLTLLKGKIKTYNIKSFDIETFGENNKFLLGGYNNGKYHSFDDPTKMIDFMLKDFKQYDRIYATNLQFDFLSLFTERAMLREAIIKQKGTTFFMCDYKGMIFADTFSIIPTSVEKLGKTLNMPKLKKPEWLGNKYKNNKEKLELRRYNAMDCKITREFMLQFQKFINELGAELKFTIASTAMNLYRHKYLDYPFDKEYIKNFPDDTPVIDFIRDAYYGGRCEAFKRGINTEKRVYRIYDVNSLYPSVMLNEYPYPDSARINNYPNIETINKMHGVSDVIIEAPKDLYYPLLPFRSKKLIFPVGTFRGVYNHIELRKALDLGYKIHKINRQIYYTKTFGGGTGGNFSLFIPDSGVINKVKAFLNWTGDANYTLKIYYPNSSLAGTSLNNFVYANISGVMQEVYNETLSIPTDAGVWNFEAVNNTVANNPFNITIYAYYPASNWIATNLTSGTLTLTANSSSNVQGNFTVPSTAMSGTYEGYIQYLDNRMAGIRLPFKVNVTTPMLVVNNTLSSMTYQRDENYGFGFTIYNITFNISNPGDYDLGIKWTSSDNMTCDSGCGYYANFYFNNTTKVLPARSSMLLIVNITMNNSLPAESVYSARIRINGTNETDAKLTAHPYSEFLQTIRLNMTKYMKLIVADIKSMDGADNIALNNSNLTNAENVTVKFYVQTINGTNNITSLTLDNITSVWLGEGNVTSSEGRLSLAINSTYFTGSNPLYFGNYYNLNVTIPAYQPGGRYIPFINMVHYPNSSVTYNATTYAGSNVIVVNNSGYFMSTNISDSDSNCYFGSNCANPTITIDNATKKAVFISISNYGPLGNISAKINTFHSCTAAGWTITNTTPVYYDCPNIASSTTFNATGYSTTCVANFNVTSPAATGTCTIYFTGTPSYNWFNQYGVNITFSSSAATTTTTTTSSASGATSSGTSSTAAKYLDITDYPSLIIVTQGKTNSTIVKVKNTNTTYTQLIKLTIENLNSSWYSISPSTTQSTAALATVNFTVLFLPASDATIKDYTASFKAISDYSSTEKSFTLRVLPTEATKAQINQSLDQFKANVTALEAELNSLKVWYNMSAAETKLKQLKTKINESENFIKAGDYNSAYALFDTIKSLINDVKTEIENAKKQSLISPSNAITYALIGGGVVAAVILAYLFWPSKEAAGRAAVTEKAGLIFGKTKEAGVGFKDRIKEALSKVKSKFSRQKTESNYKLKT